VWLRTPSRSGLRHETHRPDRWQEPENGSRPLERRSVSSHDREPHSSHRPEPPEVSYGAAHSSARDRRNYLAGLAAIAALAGCSDDEPDTPDDDPEDPDDGGAPTDDEDDALDDEDEEEEDDTV
jgi:hypothetical protein